MSATWPHSRQIESAGAKAYIFDAGTTTPRICYSDASLSTPTTHPIVADANGRFPRVYLQDGLYRELITTSADVTVWDDDNIDATPTVIPDSVAAPDAAELIKTGDIIIRTVGGTLSGYVRCNGRTIGNGSSGASERANADTSALFAYLWNGHADAILAVSSGRGSTAAADFAANKTIALPDFRLAGPFGVSDMGNTALSTPATLAFTTGSATAGASKAGANDHTIASTEVPNHTHTGTVAVTDPGHGHSFRLSEAAGTGADATGGLMTNNDGTVNTKTAFTGTPSNTAGEQIGGATTGITATTTIAATTGGGGAHTNVQSSVLGTFYIKL